MLLSTHQDQPHVLASVTDPMQGYIRALLLVFFVIVQRLGRPIVHFVIKVPIVHIADGIPFKLQMYQHRTPGVRRTVSRSLGPEKVPPNVANLEQAQTRT